MHILEVLRQGGVYSPEAARTPFKKFGICILKDYLARDTRAELRRIVEAELERAAQRESILRFDAYPDARFLLGDVLAVRALDAFKGIFFGPECVSIVKALLGTEDLVYWGDSSIQVGEAARGFHKDNVDRGDGTGDDWSRDYELVRCGFYFQDHTIYSGGLKVRLGSHNVADHLTGRVADLSSEYGDLVIWNMRLTHSGNARKLRGLSALPLHPRLEASLPRLFFLNEQLQRIAAFCAFGKPGSHLDRYIDRMNERGDYTQYFRFARKDDEAETLLARAGVTFRRPNALYGELDRTP